MPSKTHIALLFGLMFVISVGYFAINMRPASPVPDGLTTTLEREVKPQFVGSTATTPDTPTLNRLVRGQLTEIRPESNELMIDAWINFPDKSITRPLVLRTTKDTQYLCWKQTVQLPDGTSINLEDTMLAVSDTQKLYQAEETMVELDATQTLLRDSGPLSVVVALENPFSLNDENRVYQVALLGCQSP